MKIILKPAGAIIVLVVIAILGAIAFRKSKMDAAASAGDGAPLMAATPNEPLKPVAFPKQVAAGWKLSDDGKTLEKTDTVSSECPFSDIPLNADAGEVQVKVTCKTLQAGGTFQKYGLRIKGSPAGDELDIWIDPGSKVLATHGVVGGTIYDWHNSPLPDGFDMTQPHVLKIQWATGGKEWQFTLDNDRHSSQSKHLFAQMKPAYPALMNYLAQPSYQELAMR